MIPYVGYKVRLGVVHLDELTSNSFFVDEAVREEVVQDAAILAEALGGDIRIVSDAGQTLLTISSIPKVHA